MKRLCYLIVFFIVLSIIPCDADLGNVCIQSEGKCKLHKHPDCCEGLFCVTTGGRGNHGYCEGCRKVGKYCRGSDNEDICCKGFTCSRDDYCQKSGDHGHDEHKEEHHDEHHDEHKAPEHHDEHHDEQKAPEHHDEHHDEQKAPEHHDEHHEAPHSSIGVLNSVTPTGALVVVPHVAPPEASHIAEPTTEEIIYDDDTTVTP